MPQFVIWNRSEDHSQLCDDASEVEQAIRIGLDELEWEQSDIAVYHLTPVNVTVTRHSTVGVHWGDDPEGGG